MSTSRLLVVGTGAIAARHLRNARLLGAGSAVAVLHRGTPRGAASEAVALADEVFVDIDEALRWEPDAAIVANAATAHASVGIPLASRGVHLLVEKPISADLDSADRLILACREGGATLAVGYNLRFHPAIEVLQAALADGAVGRPLVLRAEAGQHLAGWRPTNYRDTVSARRALGGGAVLELSHEVDYARSLMGEVATSTARTATVSDLDVDVEDVAGLWLDFVGGAVGEIHLDLLDQAPNRRCRIVGSSGTLDWDAETGVVRLLTEHGRVWQHLDVEHVDRNETYVRELRNFMASVDGGEEPRVTGESARATLAICVEAHRSAPSVGSVVP